MQVVYQNYLQSQMIQGYAWMRSMENLAFYLLDLQESLHRIKKNNEKLLKSLENESNRKAHYTCVIVFVKHEFDPEPIITEGIWHGEILKSPRGSGGFGYDPLFLDHMTEKAVAELPSDIKNRISHRGQALHKLKLKLNQIYG